MGPFCGNAVVEHVPHDDPQNLKQTVVQNLKQTVVRACLTSTRDWHSRRRDVKPFLVDKRTRFELLK